MEDKSTVNNAPQTPVETSPKPAVEPAIVPKKSRFLSKKWLFLGVILAVLIVLGAVSNFYLASFGKKTTPSTVASSTTPAPSVTPAPTPAILPLPTLTASEEATWKTYTNTIYNFQFKYPPDWPTDLTPNSASGGNLFFKIPDYFKTHEQGLGADGMYVIEVSIFDNAVNPNDTVKQIEVNGVRGFYEITADPSPYDKTGLINPRESAFFTQDNRYFDIDFIPMFDPKSQTKQQVQEKELIYKKILSTFKFTGQSSQSSALNSPTPTCIPRPACLDATPRCMIAESANMCPPTVTPTP